MKKQNPAKYVPVVKESLKKMQELGQTKFTVFSYVGPIGERGRNIEDG